jgi:hypothetical protein
MTLAAAIYVRRRQFYRSGMFECYPVRVWPGQELQPDGTIALSYSERMLCGESLCSREPFW